MEENKFICLHCGREFLTARGLSKHENNYCENNLNKIRPKKSYKICDKCGEEISTLAFNRHYKSCDGSGKRKVKENAYHNDYDDLICKFCGKECNNKNSLAQHEIRCKENPDRINNQKGRIPWNKGLTKEIDERVLKGSLTLKEGYDTGRILPSWTGRLHTTELKDKISESRKKYLSDHPDKVPYILNHSSKTSYPELYFIDLFEKEDINLKYHKLVSKYLLDFYNDDKKFDLEIDGELHYTDNRIFCSDRDRDKFMLDLGWKIYRIRWSNYLKLDIVGKENIIKEIKNFLI